MTTRTVRFAQFNIYTAELHRREGQFAEVLSNPDNQQLRNVGETIQRINPDVILLNEFDYLASDPLRPVRLFQQNYLSRSQNGASPVEFPFVYVAPVNTGIPSGFDLNNDGRVVTTPG
ncbi:MAG: hypothetical protein ACK421_11175, partial [Pseudanabaenaceae cyanobacterium]